MMQDHHGRTHVNSLLPLSQEATTSMLTSLQDHQQLSIRKLREEYCYSNMMMIMSLLGSCCSKLEFGKSNGVTILTIIICRPCAMIFLASSSMLWIHHGGARRGWKQAKDSGSIWSHPHVQQWKHNQQLQIHLPTSWSMAAWCNQGGKLKHEPSLKKSETS
jgi:hypothetical protein